MKQQARDAVEKQDLAMLLALSCSRPHLLTLKVSELKRRLASMDVSTSGIFDKRGLAEALHTETQRRMMGNF